MKNKASLTLIHRIFSAASLLIIAAFAGFLVYVYVTFSGTLVGDVKSTTTLDPLTYLDEKRFELALVRMKLRQNLPDIPASLPDPYLPPASVTP